LRRLRRQLLTVRRFIKPLLTVGMFQKTTVYREKCHETTVNSAKTVGVKEPGRVRPQASRQARWPIISYLVDSPFPGIEPRLAAVRSLPHGGRCLLLHKCREPRTMLCSQECCENLWQRQYVVVTEWHPKNWPSDMSFNNPFGDFLWRRHVLLRRSF
jgi:hypothetical protein